MNKNLKYLLHILLFFILMLIIMYLIDTFYKDVNIILFSIAGTLGYSVVLISEERKKKRNKENKRD